jgi:hypothetical protein
MKYFRGLFLGLFATALAGLIVLLVLLALDLWGRRGPPPEMLGPKPPASHRGLAP